jgi:hypothetical protein
MVSKHIEEEEKILDSTRYFTVNRNIVGERFTHPQTCTGRKIIYSIKHPD